MKIKRWIIVLMVICTFFLEGCQGVQLDTSNEILAPKNNQVPIQGTWKIDKYKFIGKSTLTTEDANNLVGKAAEFDINYASFSDDICNNVEYKVKNVDAEYYFYHLYQKSLEDLGLNTNTKNVEVISVTSGDKLFYDFIKVNDNQMLAYTDNTFFYLTKTSNKTDIALNKSKGQNNDSLDEFSTVQGDRLNGSGVLLGLKCTDSGDQGTTYRTLWISSKNNEMNTTFQVSNLLVPRKLGFWMVGVNRVTIGTDTKDMLFSYPIDGNRNNTANKTNVIQGSYFTDILFVANDYISTEYSFIGNDKKTSSLNRWKVIPMDKISDSKGIRISDVAGEIGNTALVTAGKAFLSTQKDQEDFEQIPREDSFALQRKNGYWAVEGRLNSKDPTSDACLDFDVNITAPSKMLNYNDLQVSWGAIKERVPEVVDAYASPGKDIILVISKKVISIYAIQGKKLSDKPLSRINIHEGESVVMAEWATGVYVDRWQKTVSSLGTALED